MAQTILITGCSSGIGLDCALMMKKHGWRVFASARKKADLEHLQSLGLEPVSLDVNDSASITEALSGVLEKTGGTLDALFNNAGILYAGAIEDLSREMMRAQFETNVFGSMEMIRQVLPIMRKQGHGRIVQNSSILGIVAIPYCGAYNASKFAIEGFCNTLRLELRGSPIHLSIINPGPIVSKLRNHARDLYVTHVQHAQTGVHKKNYENMEKNYFSEVRKKSWMELTPEAVGKKLIHAVESPRPCAHYYIGSAAKMMAFLRRILPDGVMDWVLANRR